MEQRASVFAGVREDNPDLGFVIDLEALDQRRGRSERSQLDLERGCDVIAQSMAAPVNDTLHASLHRAGELRLERKFVRSNQANTGPIDLLAGMMSLHPFAEDSGSCPVVESDSAHGRGGDVRSDLKYS